MTQCHPITIRAPEHRGPRCSGTSINSNSGQLFADLPQSPRGNGIGCARSHTMHFCAVVTRKRAGDLAVGAIYTAHAVEHWAGRAPHAGGSALLDRLLV